MKSPFKKKSIVDSAINVGVGGAANVAFDYLYAQLPADTLASIGVSADTLKNAIKIAGGVLAGTMISNRYARAAADGIATVGVSNLVDSLINDEEGGTSGTGRVPFIGKVRRTGQRNFRVAGTGKVAGTAFMGK